MKTAPLVSLIALAVPLAVVGLLVAVVPRGAAPGAGEKDPPTTFSAGAGGSRAIGMALRCGGVGEIARERVEGGRG